MSQAMKTGKRGRKQDSSVDDALIQTFSNVSLGKFILLYNFDFFFEMWIKTSHH
jgi:hypothetical protein